MQRIIIAGSRTFTDYELLERTMDAFIQSELERDPDPGVEIISGMAKGADQLGLKYAEIRGYPVRSFPAKWELGRGAGPQRNREMAAAANACVVFWDGVSKGTANMIKLAQDKKLTTRVVRYADKK